MLATNRPDTCSVWRMPDADPQDAEDGFVFCRGNVTDEEVRFLANGGPCHLVFAGSAVQVDSWCAQHLGKTVR